jgi:hypothetical protein
VVQQQLWQQPTEFLLLQTRRVSHIALSGYFVGRIDFNPGAWPWSLPKVMAMPPISSRHEWSGGPLLQAIQVRGMAKRHAILDATDQIVSWLLDLIDRVAPFQPESAT